MFLPAENDPAFLDEVLAFPAGRHDDQVDSMVQAIDWWESQRQMPAALFGRY